MAKIVKGFLQFFATQTTATVPESMPSAFYDKTLLTLLRHKMQLHMKFAQRRPMPRKQGDTVSFRKIVKLAPATTPLTEGVTPTGNSVGMTEITAQTAQYGDFIEFSDRVSFQTIDPVITEYIKELSDQANETLDVLARDVLNAGTNVMYANDKLGRDDTAAGGAGLGLAAGDTLKLVDVRKAVRFFRKNYVKPVAKGDYACLISPDTEFDFFDDEDFQAIANYGNRVEPFLENEVGRVHNVRFFMTPNAKTFAGAGQGGVDIHASIFLGQGAYGITTIKGEGDVKSIIKGLGSAGTNDPLDQRQTAGWKVNAFVTVRLNETAMIRYEHVPSV